MNIKIKQTEKNKEFQFPLCYLETAINFTFAHTDNLAKEKKKKYKKKSPLFPGF